MAERLIDLYSKRKASRGFPFPKDGEWSVAFEDKEQYEELFTEEDGTLPDKIEGEKFKTVIYNEDTIRKVLRDLMEEGIKVVSYDAEVAFPGRDLDVQPSSAKNIGLTLLESIAKSVNYEGQIGVVSAMATAPNQNLWISYIEEELQANEAYANIEYLGVVYGDDEYQKSFDETQALLNQYPDLKGLIVPTTVGAPAVSKCIQDAGRDVKVTGLTLASDMKTFIEAGICDETFLWNPIDLGYVASYAAVALVNGDITGAAGDNVVAGDYDLTVEAKDDAGATILYLNKLNVFNTETVDAWIDIL